MSGKVPVPKKGDMTNYQPISLSSVLTCTYLSQSSTYSKLGGAICFTSSPVWICERSILLSQLLHLCIHYVRRTTVDVVYSDFSKALTAFRYLL